MRFRDVPQFSGWGNYVVDHGWRHLLDTLERYQEEYGLELCPDFQRGHVWTPHQQTAFVEYGLRGGHYSMNILTNCVGWLRGMSGPFQMVDGLQRVTAVLRFLRNEVPVFGGHYFRDFEDNMSPMEPRFRWYVNDLNTRAEVLSWYLDLNSGGTVHTARELDRVRDLLREEQSK